MFLQLQAIRASFLWDLTLQQASSAPGCETFDIGTISQKGYDAVAALGDVDVNGVEDFAVSFSIGGINSHGIVFVLLMVSEGRARLQS